MRLLLQLLAVAVASLAVAGPHHARARDACNQTVSPYEEVTSPEAEPGRAVTCYYRLRTARKDLVIRLRFRRFKVGVLVNGTHCLRGYLQIVDGNAKTELSNRKEPGMFCGETEQPQTFISETSFVKVVFHVDNFTDQTYFSFESRVEQQLEVYARYGHHPELYPNRRGQVVPGSYCERIFRDCRLQTCYVQSPAYPGVYPRGLHCRYHLNTRLPFIKLYIENEVFNIDGQRCENIMTCPMRPISSGAENCPYDYIKVYDGKNESAPVIGVFCGMGHFPYSIIGTSEDLLVEFLSSPAGPLLNTGFHFNVGSWPGHGKLAGVRNGTCDWLLAGDDLGPDQEGIFQSVAHWYPPHSSCTYLLQGRPGQVVRLYFPSFRINTIEAPILPYDGDCGESLTLYDASWADDARIIKTFCDTFSRAMEKHDFVSTGSSMFVRFESKTGSYSGSSLYYWAHYDFFNASTSGDPVAGTACDEQFVAWRSSAGRLRSPLNTLVYKRHADPHHSVRCQYRFISDRRLFARVILTIESVAFKDNPYSAGRCGDCVRDRADKLVVLEPAGNASSPVSAVLSACMCHGGVARPPLQVVSRGERLTLELRLDAAHAAASYFKHAPPLFEARYQFVHAPLCGPALLSAAAAGELRFPDFAALGGWAEPPRSLHCIWQLAVRPGRHLWLHFEDARLASRDCRLTLRLPSRAAPMLFACGVNASALQELPVIAAADLLPPDDEAGGDDYPQVTVEFVSDAWSAADYFRMVWTELSRVEVAQDSGSSPSSGEDADAAVEEEEEEDPSLPSSYYVTRVGAVEDCEFACPGEAGYCIPARLVCDGVANCPANATLAHGDEGGPLCARPATADVPWLAVAVAAAAAAVLALAACLVIICRSCCSSGSDADKPIAGEVVPGVGGVDDERAYDGYRR